MTDTVASLRPAEFGMWAIFAVIAATLVLYAAECAALELTSLDVICALLLLFYWNPVIDDDGKNLLGPDTLLAGQLSIRRLCVHRHAVTNNRLADF